MQQVLIFLGFGPISESYQIQGGLSPENSTHANEQENLSAIHSSSWPLQVHFEPLRRMASDPVQPRPEPRDRGLVALQPHCETNGDDDGEAVSRQGPDPGDSARQAAAVGGFTKQWPCLPRAPWPWSAPPRGFQGAANHTPSSYNPCWCKWYRLLLVLCG